MGSWFRKGALRDDKKKTATRETTTAFARLILDFSGMGTNGDLLSHFSKIQLVLNAAFWLIELPLGKKLFVDIFYQIVGFYKLTIIPRARMDSESIGHSGSRNTC